MATYVFKWEKVYSRGMVEGSSTIQIASKDIRVGIAAAQLQIAQLHSVSPNEVHIRDIQRIHV
jgi:hypothetical protein